MAGFGIGIGSFVDGMMKGYKFVNDMENEKRKSEREDKRLGLEERRVSNDEKRAVADADFRKHELRLREQGIGLQREQLDISRRTADANIAYTGANTDRLKQQIRFGDEDRPLQVAEAKANSERNIAVAGNEADLARRARADREDADKAVADSKAQHEQSARAAIKPIQGEGGVQGYEYGGKTFKTTQEAMTAFERDHGTYYDRVLKGVGEKNIARHIANGDLEKANAVKTFIENDEVRKVYTAVGHLQNAIAMGDWDTASTVANTVLSRSKLIDTQGYEVKAEPIKGEDGKVAGMRLKLKGKNGEAQNVDFASQSDAMRFIQDLVHPEKLAMRYEQQRQTADAGRAKIAEKMGEARVEIMKKLELAKIPDPDAVFNEILTTISKSMDGMKLTPEEMVKKAREQAELVIRARETGGYAGRGITPPAASRATGAARPPVFTGQ